jgi:hypothetical protein
MPCYTANQQMNQEELDGQVKVDMWIDLLMTNEVRSGTFHAATKDMKEAFFWLFLDVLPLLVPQWKKAVSTSTSDNRQDLLKQCKAVTASDEAYVVLLFYTKANRWSQQAEAARLFSDTPPTPRRSAGRQPQAAGRLEITSRQKMKEYDTLHRSILESRISHQSWNEGVVDEAIRRIQQADSSGGESSHHARRQLRRSMAEDVLVLFIEDDNMDLATSVSV